MKRYITALLLVCAITVMAQPTQTTTKWEYKFDDRCSEKRANELATQGWELFSMSMGAWQNISTPYCVFRRQK